MGEKKEDLAGPGIGDYAELEKTLPLDYNSLLSPRDTQTAVFVVKDYIETHLCFFSQFDSSYRAPDR